MQGASAAPLDAALAPRSFGVEDRERFTPLPSASGDGLKKAVADPPLPAMPAPADWPGQLDADPQHLTQVEADQGQDQQPGQQHSSPVRAAKRFRVRENRSRAAGPPHHR